MRRTLDILAALLLAAPLLLQAQRAAAQAQPQPAPEEDYALPDLASDGSSRDFGGAADDVDLDGVVVQGHDRDAEEGEAPASGDRHTVQSGDTLWDLSARYLGSPWYWPKVWSFNPQIENPHWIYPGDEIRLGDGTQPPQPVAAAQPAGDEGDVVPYEEDEVSIAGQIGFQGRGSVQIPSLGFLSAKEVEEAGRIAKSWEEKELLYEGDRIYIELEEGAAAPKVGESVVLFRTEREVTHPDSGDRLGYVIRVLGSAKWVRSSGQKLATAVITRSVSEISRGDRVGPAGFVHYREVNRIENAATVRGSIAGTMDQEIGEFAQGHLVFLDKGTSHGVQTGNTMSVILASDGLADDGFSRRYDEELPAERIGELLVVDSRPGSSVGLVLSSIRELRVGDRVEMRPAGSSR